MIRKAAQDEFARVSAEGSLLEGFPSRTEIVGIFEQASGRRAGDIDYFELLAAVRLAITLIPVTAIGFLAFGPPVDEALEGVQPYRSLFGFLVLIPLMWACLRGK